ncbi:SDR family NAD(P)-dependent oxidoreductase [Leptolyngbya sp. NIES-2104]|uniref:SDR family NAD(P)-dependent oxidoreductase n=1 Tax=Leptolyngbya sp. NIES-2104 TaxID=1552121 RepID=UPI0006EC47F4|nr:SDR family oxidoreductase [Leptolyngbya sp. NIES-2104]GAP98018.1 3-oxoacyl-[acyl-carrier protein] reductase [Leptolyngbya sp. NIES-2104]
MSEKIAFPSVAHKTLSELISLENRVVVVTGAARGIGQAIVNRLHQSGAKIIAVDRRTEPFESSNGILSVTADIRQSDQVEQVAERAMQEFGRLDVWVNDAGLLPIHTAMDLTDEQWQETIDTNLTGTFYGCRAAGRKMKAQGSGVIINIASSLAFHSVPEQPHYVASKWGVRGLTAALANEWGKYGIRVVAVGPGLTDTPGVEANMQELDRLQGGDARGATAKMYPSRRMGEPDDIARMVLVLASDLAAFVTGAEILVDGGEVYSSPAG